MHIPALFAQVTAIPFLWTAFMAIPGHQLPFYQEATNEPTAEAAPPSPIQAVVHRQGLTVLAAVEQAIRGVLGAAVGNETPLVQAGLDSLGTPCLDCGKWRLLAIPYHV